MEKKSRGRPVQSNIRQNIVEILYVMGEGYGYDIYKAYAVLFPKATMRSIYYNLKKGIILGEFKVSEIKVEKGDYSWGKTVEKIYYALGPNARPAINPEVKKYFDGKK